MLALLIHCYSNGLFSSRRIECATYREVAVRFVAANLRPDHDTIASFRRTNTAAIKAALLQVLLMAREIGLLRLGTVSIDGTKWDTNASKIRSVRYDRARVVRTRLAADIAVLTARAEAADVVDQDPQALPVELAQCETLRAKLDAACTRLKAGGCAEPTRPDPYSRQEGRPTTRARDGLAGRPNRPTIFRFSTGRATSLTRPAG